MDGRRPFARGEVGRVDDPALHRGDHESLQRAAADSPASAELGAPAKRSP
jgi:hypothetical protein